jgi:hypothetical protein
VELHPESDTIAQLHLGTQCKTDITISKHSIMRA